MCTRVPRPLWWTFRRLARARVDCGIWGWELARERWGPKGWKRGTRGRAFRPRLQRRGGPVQFYLRQAHCLQSPQRQTRGGCGSLGHPGHGLLPPTQTGAISAGFAWASLEVMSRFKNAVTANSTFPGC